MNFADYLSINNLCYGSQLIFVKRIPTEWCVGVKEPGSNVLSFGLVLLTFDDYIFLLAKRGFSLNKNKTPSRSSKELYSSLILVKTHINNPLIPGNHQKL